jgi:uncharacterized protein YodC (DUF2158 family)
MVDEFKPGDVVQLKSGGPRMTIVSMRGGQADTEWFDEKKNPRTGTFALTSLDRAPDLKQRGQAGGPRGGTWS